MFSALLLPLVLAGSPAAVVQNDDPALQLWISDDRRFLPGDRAKVHVRARDDGYLVVLHADPDGYLRVLFPLDPGDDNFVRGGKRYEIRDRGNREAFDTDRTGRGMVYAAVSHAPFRFGDYVLSDHWDYRALAPDRLPREPETELTELVRRMAGGSFDYDVLTYDVLERVVYASRSYDYYSYSRPYYSSFYYDDPWCGGYYWGGCGSGVHVGIYFGRPYRYRHYPYRYGYHGFYDPFFYDPYYYRPAYYYPVYRYPYRSYSYYPRYRDWRYDHRYRDGRAYTPYRFRGSDGVRTDFRDRNYGFRSAVNTVYTPPVSRFSEPERASTLRRAVERRDPDRPIESRRATAQPAGAERREPAATRREPVGREAVTERREAATRRAEERPRPAVESGRIEARRARESEPERGTVRDARESRSESLPQEIRGRRATGDEGPAVGRAAMRAERRELPEARPSRSAEERQAPSRAEPRAEPRSEPRVDSRPAPREGGGGSGGGRVERSSPPPSSGHDGGRRPAGGGGGGGGVRRR